MKKTLVKIMGGLLLVLVTVIGSFFIFLSRPVVMTPKIFRIEKGESGGAIIHRLYEEGIIPHETLFKIYIYFLGISSRIRAGEYEFPSGVAPKHVAAALLEGDFRTYPVTIIEGWRLTEIADYLEKSGVAKAGDFLARCQDKAWIQSLGLEADSLEGYLFPDTYRIYGTESVDVLIQKLLNHFHEIFDATLKERAAAMGLSLHQVVTLASIIEKETSQASEYPLVSGVFHNRLKKGMPLQSDPTVIYGVKNFDGDLTRKHLDSPTPYNTYVHPGLPPGPIASPGRGALLGALYPVETDYFYFVSKNDGTHIFASTLEEHNQNVWKYQKSPKKSER